MLTEQQRLKKINPRKRRAYKTILLAEYGAQMNEHTDFFDPWHGLLVPITLQLFIADLMEKLADYVTFVQTNTDGIMFVNKEGVSDETIKAIIDEWQERTGFTLKLGKIKQLYQKDVNNYICFEDDELVYKGEAVKNYDFSDAGYAAGSIFNSKEPSIIAQGIVNALIYNKMPEQTVEENKHNLALFQYGCKKGKYDTITYDVTYYQDMSQSTQEIQSPSRIFAWNAKDASGMVYKHGVNKKGIDFINVQRG